MNTLDKVYDLTIDIKNIDVKYNSYAKFFDDDRETSVIRIKLLNDKTPIDLEGCTVEAEFILANNTYHDETCKIINSSEGVVELQLCQKCLVKGENIVRLSILKDNEISNTPVITYEVRKGLYSDNPSFNDDPLTPILSQMLLDIKVTKVNQIELQERYEKSLPKIEGKIKEVESLINRVDTAIASGTQDLEVKEARVDKNGKSYAKLGDRLNEVDSQLEQSVPKVVASKIGMIANDISRSKENTSILSTAINKGHSIIIDDNYYIDSIGVELHGDISIEGMNNKGALLLNNVTSCCFYINDFSSIILKNIKIQNNEKHTYFLYNKNTNWNADEFRCENVEILDNVSIIYSECDRSINPLNNRLGFKYFSAKGNIIRNTPVMVFNLYNVPGEYEVAYNKVTNFKNRVFNNSMTNDAPNDTEFKMCTNFHIHHNTVICEDDWWGTEGDEYFTFCLIEGYKVVYEHNHVEGMKKIGEYLNDSYLCCTVVIYKNNTFKNNFVFATNPSGSLMLLSSKSGTTNSQNLIREYTNNIYTIEKEFITKFSSGGYTLEAQLYHFMEDCDKFIFNNNILNLDIELRLRANSAPVVINYVEFNNNEINVDSIANTLFPLNTDDIISSKTNIEICNNEILAFSGSCGLFGIKKSSNNALINSIKLENNSFKRVGFGQPICKTLVVRDNIFLYDNDSTEYVCDGGEFYDFINKGNIHKSAKDNAMVIYRTPHGLNDYIEENEYYYNVREVNGNGILFKKIDKSDTNTRVNYIVELTAHIDGIVEKDTLLFTYGYDVEGDYNYLEYTNSSGVTERMNLSTDTNTRYPKFESNQSPSKFAFKIIELSAFGVFVQHFSPIDKKCYTKLSVRGFK